MQPYAELNVVYVLKIMFIKSKKVLLWLYRYSSDCCPKNHCSINRRRIYCASIRWCDKMKIHSFREASFILQGWTGRLNCKYRDNYSDSGERAQASTLASIRLLEASVCKSQALAKWYLSVSFDLLERRRTLAIKSNRTFHLASASAESLTMWAHPLSVSWFCIHML